MGKPRRWTDEKIEAALLEHIEKLGRMPNSTELRKLDSRLEGAVTRSGGFRSWASRLGRPGDIRSAWPPAATEANLVPHVERLGRMPTASELHEAEGNDRLANAVAKCGGYRHWAKVFGVSLKDSTTSRGQDWEDHEEEFFREMGFDVQRQTTKAPFDLLINEHRIDVKSAKWSDYERESGALKGQHVRGFVFANLRRGVDCDFFDLLCLKAGEFAHRFLIPADVASVTTLTITERQLGGYGKYSQFEDALYQLHASGCTRD